MSSEPTAGTPRDPWSQKTRDTWFFGALTVSTLALVGIFSHYAIVLLFSATFTVVTWPLFERILARTGGKRALAAVLTGLLLAVVVFVPLGLVLYLFALEGIGVVHKAIALVQSGDLERIARDLVERTRSPEISVWTDRFLPEDVDPVDALMGPVRSGALDVLNAAGAALPGLITTAVTGGIDTVIFVFATVSLYMEGPAVLAALRDLSPIDDRHERHLFGVFQEFSRNLVVGAFATAATLGLGCAIGYAIGGSGRVVFLGLLTGVLSFIPVVGVFLVSGPVALYVWTLHGFGWGLFVAIWCLVLTLLVDNILKPLLLRGSSDIHPLLIFLAVFGGLETLGAPGIFVGPVTVAFFLALLQIYREDYLGIPPRVRAPRKQTWAEKRRAAAASAKRA
jgi:predicted PurR-regulated permease PerM